MTTTTSGAQRRIFSLILVLFSVTVALVMGEMVLRVKNRAMNTYDVEMWRYAKELKAKSDDPELDFDHVKSKSATLQKVEIRLNGVLLLVHRYDDHRRIKAAVRHLRPEILWPVLGLLWIMAITVSQGSSAKFIYLISDVRNRRFV